MDWWIHCTRSPTPSSLWTALWRHVVLKTSEHLFQIFGTLCWHTYDQMIMFGELLIGSSEVLLAAMLTHSYNWVDMTFFLTDYVTILITASVSNEHGYSGILAFTFIEDFALVFIWWSLTFRPVDMIVLFSTSLVQITMAGSCDTPSSGVTTCIVGQNTSKVRAKANLPYTYTVYWWIQRNKPSIFRL